MQQPSNASRVPEWLNGSSDVNLRKAQFFIVSKLSDWFGWCHELSQHNTRTACVLSSFLGASDSGHNEGSELTFLTNSTVICLYLSLSIYLQHIKLFLLHRYKGWDSSDSIATRPSAGRPRNCGSIHGTGNRIFTSPKRPDRFLGPMNLPQGALSTGLPQPGRAADYPPLCSCKIKVCAAVPPLTHVFTVHRQHYIWLSPSHTLRAGT